MTTNNDTPEKDIPEDETLAQEQPDAAQADEEALVEELPSAADVREIEPEDEADEEPEAEASEIEEETAVVEDMGDAADSWTPARLKASIEALLFTTPYALNIARLRKALGNVDARTLRATLSQLQAEYDARTGGLEIVEGPEGFQMCTRPEHSTVILRLHRQRKKNPLTATALETLAIVAYKQPITRAEVEMIRGVESSGILRNLTDMGMVKVVGRKDVIGRPQLYGTTSLFLQTFGLRSLAELPSIQRLREQYGETTSLSDRIASADDREEEADIDETAEPERSESDGDAERERDEPNDVGADEDSLEGEEDDAEEDAFDDADDEDDEDEEPEDEPR